MRFLEIQRVEQMLLQLGASQEVLLQSWHRRWSPLFGRWSCTSFCQDRLGQRCLEGGRQTQQLR